jgi:VanZ family protein
MIIPLLRRVAPSSAALAWMGLIFYLSSLSQAEASRALESSAVSWMGVLRSYAAHLVLYGVLASLALTSAWSWKSAGATHQMRWAVAAATFTTLYGVSDEYHQSLVFGRSGSFADVLVNASAAIGAAAGVYLMGKWWRGRRADLSTVPLP